MAFGGHRCSRSACCAAETAYVLLLRPMLASLPLIIRTASSMSMPTSERRAVAAHCDY